ncbi:MAG: hypothetical protein ABIH25_00705 [Candidatus Woesearchaeota archaeon]
MKIDSNDAYDSLIKIKYIGNKIATLYLRELCWLFDIKPNDYTLIFPIDTWVRQIINRLNILESSEEKFNDSEIQKKTIDFCLKNNINPMKFNAGIWYIGKNSLNIVLEEISK